jgi:hypothetical protein
LGELQIRLEDKHAHEKKKKKDSKQMIPASAKKCKKKSKSQTVQEKRQQEEQAQHQIADMLHANAEQTDHCPCNGGELFFI